MKQRRIGIIGAGPAGIMAALEAARHGADVLLFERNTVVGRKIHVTGNGRCNITNTNAAPGRYTCASRGFMEKALARFGYRETATRLEELGILTYNTPDGWCYPLSDSAATVADTLTAMLDLAGVDIRLQQKISDIRRTRKGFTLIAGDPSQGLDLDRVIVACGGMAYPALGSKGELFPILENLGHTVVPIYPALAPLTGDVKAFHKLQGVRLDAGLKVFDGKQQLGDTVGNLMFTQTGFSGPAAMDVSHWVSTRPDRTLTLSIDLVPYHRAALLDLIRRLRFQPLPLRVVLGAVMPVKIPPVLLHMAKLPEEVRLPDVPQKSLDRLLGLISHLKVRLTGTRGFNFAQLSTGGIPVTEVDPETMESRVVPGVHFAGEVMDVIGPCGGYNLQWCWTCGALAGAGAATSSSLSQATR